MEKSKSTLLLEFYAKVEKLNICEKLKEANDNHKNIRSAYLNGMYDGIDKIMNLYNKLYNTEN